MDQILDLSEFISIAIASKAEGMWDVKIKRSGRWLHYYVSGDMTEYEAKEMAYMMYMDRI